MTNRVVFLCRLKIYLAGIKFVSMFALTKWKERVSDEARTYSITY